MNTGEKKKQNWGSLELRFLGMKIVADPIFTHLPDIYVCHRVRFGSSTTKGVRINRRKPSKTQTLNVEAWVTP